MRWPPAPWLLPITLLVLLVVINPRGYVGGGADDWHYLEAARCLAEHGLCLPTNHWQARLALLIPMGTALASLGDGEWSVALVPALYALMAVGLLVANIQRHFDSSAAVVAGAVFAMTPLLSLQTLQPSVDVPEFAWIMATLFAIQCAVEKNDWLPAAVGGACLALALMSRMTSAAFLPILALGWWMLPRERRSLAVPFVAALALVLGGEALAYAVATGDPLYGWNLSLHHGRIPTAELPPGVDLTRSPILNLDFIRNWRPSMGIRVHWTVDPLLNLLADPLCGLTVCGAVALGLTRWRDWRAEPWLVALTGAAFAHFILLTYVLAIDPKPRMFLFEFAVAATMIGTLGVRAWRAQSRLLVGVLIALIALRGLIMAYDQPDVRRIRATAAQWIATAPTDSLAIDDWSRRTLAILPAARRLPLVEQAPRRTRMILTQASCGGGQVLREQRLERGEWAPLEWLRSRHILLKPQLPVTLCLVAPD